MVGSRPRLSHLLAVCSQALHHLWPQFPHLLKGHKPCLPPPEGQMEEQGYAGTGDSPAFLLPTSADPLPNQLLNTQSVSTLLASVSPQNSLGSPDQTIAGSQATHSNSSRGRVVRGWKARGVLRAGLLQVGLWPPQLSAFLVGLISSSERGGELEREGSLFSLHPGADR